MFTLRYNTPAQNPDLGGIQRKEERIKEYKYCTPPSTPPTKHSAEKRQGNGVRRGAIQTMTAVDQLVMTAGGKAARRREQGLLPCTVQQERRVNEL